MKATISKDFSFSAAHHLRGVPDDHPCHRVHGHNYRVTVEVSGDVQQDTGFVIDYHRFKAFGRYLDETLDHQDLNQVVGFDPTAEHLAGFLVSVARDYLKLAGVSQHLQRISVSVSETDKTWATVEESW